MLFTTLCAQRMDYHFVCRLAHLQLAIMPLDGHDPCMRSRLCRKTITGEKNFF